MPPRDALLATPWYPTPFNRMGGSFVADQALITARLVDTVGVLHAQEWPGGSPAQAARLRPAFDAVLDTAAAQRSLTVTGEAGPLTRVPVFTVGGASVPQRAEAAVRDVRRAVGELTADVVHGHVGYLGGLVAARLAVPGAAVFATEHSTGLRAVLADPQGRDQYAEVLARVQRLFCVSEVLREQVLAVLPEFAARVEVLANPVAFDGVPRRAAPPERLRRWLFVGGLIERKGVVRLVRAFAVAARENREVELTIYGQGPLRERLVELARAAGVADRLRLPGLLPHDALLAELPRHDVLFAPSAYETFHLVVPEAVAAGLPVIVSRSGGPQEALAGVEDRVGVFVDVEDSPDQLVQAWRDLSANLDVLDLDGACRELAARYGHDAIARRLAQAYGVPAARALRVVQPLQRVPAVRPERLVLLAVSGWRRYSVAQELAAAAGLRLETVVVTRDPGIAEMAAGLRVTVPRAPAHRPPLRALPRRLLRRLRGRLLRGAGLRPAATLTPADLDGATLLVADCQSMPLARDLLAAAPGRCVITELDRGLLDRGLLDPRR